MSITDSLVEQCRKPDGLLGRTMLKIMNVADVGMTDWAISQMGSVSGQMLDIGCGSGKTVSVLSKTYPKSKIFGVDYAEEAIHTAVKTNEKKIKSGAVEIRQASVTALPFTDKSFACITAIRTHYFWPDLKKSFQEVYRVLSNDGKFLILSELYKISYHMQEYNTNATLSRLLKEIGFKSVEILEKNKCICVIAAK